MSRKWQFLGKIWQVRGKQRWRSSHLTVLLIISSISLAVGITAAVTYQLIRHFILEDLQENALLKVTFRRHEIDEWLGDSRQQIEAMANTPIVKTMDWSLVKPYMESELKRLGSFHLFSLINPDGSYQTTIQEKTNANVSDRKHFQKSIAGFTFISDPLRSRSSNMIAVFFTTPIWSKGYVRPIGVVSGAVKLDQLYDNISNLKYGEGSYAFAINSEGVPIVDTKGKLEFNIITNNQSLLQSSDPNLAQLSKSMINRDQGIKLTKIKGKSVYVVYAPLENNAWSIALVIPQEELEKSLNPLNWLATVIAGLLIVAIGGAFWQVSTAEKNRARAERESLVNLLTSNIRGSLNIDQILQVTVEEIGKLLHLDQTAFGWYDPENTYLKIDRQYCPTNKLSCRLVLIDNQGRLIKIDEQVSYLAIPVSTQQDLLGYLICLAPPDWFWSATDRALLKVVGDQLAIAIYQSRLYTQTQQQVAQLDITLNNLKKTQAFLVQSEKMSSLGQMVAGIAHEINNPISFIYGNLPHTHQYVNDLLKLVDLYRENFTNIPPEIADFEEEIDLPYIQQDLVAIFASMRSGADRIRQIILSLRNFARLDESEEKLADIHEGIENSLLLLNHRLNNSQISIIKNYGKLPKIQCFPGQLNQVFLNIINNSIDALTNNLTKKPTIIISTEVQYNQSIVIKITDNGPGIPQELRDKVFDPFFTTKPIGQGTGLGLTICYQIVTEVNGGKINIVTPEMGGTEIIIEIPLA